MDKAETENFEFNDDLKCLKELTDFVSDIVGTENVVLNDTTVLGTMSLDIYVPSKQVAINYCGVVSHSEKYGKTQKYHLYKLEECNKQGIKLIQIFGDEYANSKEVVFSKIKRALKEDSNLTTVFARKCTIKEVEKSTAEVFLNKNHIQGFGKGTVYLGLYYNELLVGIMAFKRDRNDNNDWELTRFATDNNYHITGAGGKLFKYFVKHYNPDVVKSFADRRWTLDKDNNLYVKIGFTLDYTLAPDYRYIYEKDYGLNRMHKFGFRKKSLIKRYPWAELNMDMTEREMCDKIGAYRIWDCGLFKYVWKKEGN